MWAWSYLGSEENCLKAAWVEINFRADERILGDVQVSI